MNDTRVGRGLSLAFVWFWGELIPFDFLCFIFDYILFIPLFFSLIILLGLASGLLRSCEAVWSLFTI